MSCEAQKAAYQAAEARVTALYQSLKVATDFNIKARLIQEIEAQETIVEKDEAAYNQCVAQSNKVINVSNGSIEIAYTSSVTGDKTLTKPFASAITFTGIGTPKSISVPPFTISAFTTINVALSKGSFDQNSEAMALATTASGSFDGIGINMPLNFTTGTVVSPTKKYTGAGAAVNSSLVFALVAAGSFNAGLLGITFTTFEYYIRLTGTLASSPIF